MMLGERQISHKQASSHLLPSVSHCVVGRRIPRLAQRNLSCSSNNGAKDASAAKLVHVPDAEPSKQQYEQVKIKGCAPCMNGLGTVTIDEAKVVTKFIAETLLPTRHGKFRLRGYKHSIDGSLTFSEPTAIIYGQVEGLENVPVRVHDACYTSEVLGSLKCDCSEQLQLALKMIQEEGTSPGMVIYLQQEGRGIGLANKIAAYSLQEQGLDTVDANRALGLPDDCREYTSVVNILRDLNIKSIRLITNNPRKLNQLTQLGVNVTGRMPCQVQGQEVNQGYLDTKRDRMNHLLDGSWCYWDHEGEPRANPTRSMDEENGGMGLPNGAQITASGKVILDSVAASVSSGL